MVCARPNKRDRGRKSNDTNREKARRRATYSIIESEKNGSCRFEGRKFDLWRIRRL